MKTCPTCGGRGEVLTPGWFWVQLHELGAWNDHLDYPTLDEARVYAQNTKWGRKVRIIHGRQIVWQGR